VRRQSRRLLILLADDHQLILDGIRHALEEAGDEFEIVVEATRGSSTRTRRNLAGLNAGLEPLYGSNGV
jgi:DNA-binding NarL/FixJ family response regulator